MSIRQGQIDRRALITGQVAAHVPKARVLHIASAVVTARAQDCGEIARRIAEMPGTEVHGIEGTKIVVVMESEDGGEIGSRLTEMALMEGVFSANLVFEQIEPINDQGADG
jgi:nitrate reductase NapD